MPCRLIISILFLLCTKIIFPQSDSLLIELNNTPFRDTIKVNLYNEVAFSYLYSNREKTQEYADSAISLANVLDFSTGLRKAQYIKATAYSFSGEDDLALTLHQKLQEECRKANDLENLGRSLNSMAFIYQNKFQLDKALECAKESLEIMEKIGNDSRAAIANHTIASTYSLLKEYDIAKRYLEKSGNLFKKTGDEYRYGVILQSMATVSEGEEAIKYAKEGLAVLEKTDDVQGQGMCYWSMGDGYLELKDYQNALENYEKALKIFIEVNYGEGIAYMNASLGLMYTFLSDFEKAYVYLSVAKSDPLIKDIPDTYIPYYKGWAQYYAGTNNYEKSILYLDSLTIIQDSLFTREKAEQLVVTEARLQTKEKEAQLAQKELEIQKKTNSRNSILIISLLALLGIIAAFSYFRNLQIRKQKEAELAFEIQRNKADHLAEMDKLKSNFFANISHEFRTPLTLIQGPLNQMRDGTFSGDRKKYYDLMYRNVIRLKELINQILDLSKLENNKATLELQPLEINQFTRQIAYTLQSWMDQKSIDYEFDIPEERLWVNVDKDKYEKILMNLLSNAVKYTPEGGKVIFNVRNEVKNEMSIIDLKVKDTGIGIKETDKDHIFKRYFRGNEQEDGSISSGIGLALTKELVHLFDGELTFESEYGKGTTFRAKLELPLSEKGNEDEMILNSELPKGSIVYIQNPKDVFNNFNDPRKKVLVVEDHPDVRQYILDSLDDKYHCITAVNGKDGMEKAMNEIPDIIVSDVMMPELDGIAMTQKIKSDVRTNHIPIIMLTAKVGQENKLDGLKKGADDYLTKPFDQQELLVRINNLLKSREILKDKFQSVFTMRPDSIEVDSEQQVFLRSVRKIIQDNLDNEQFGVEVLAKEVGFSRSQLHRKLKALLDKSPNELIREFKLIRAKELLDQKFGNVSEVAYATGFSNLSYFSKAFKEQFGVLPSEVLE